MGEKIDKILEDYYQKRIDLVEVRKQLLLLYNVIEPKLLYKLFFAFLKWAKQADLNYPDEMLIKDFEQFNEKNNIQPIKSVCLFANKSFCILGMKNGSECNFKGDCIHKQIAL